MDQLEQAHTKIPASVVKRLPKYLSYTQRLRREGVAWVSSMDLGEALGLTSSTVRQDLSHIDFYGVSKRGYSTAGLETALAESLGADREICVVVVGAGNMGRALLLHDEFMRQSFKMCGIFDSDSQLFGEKVGKLLVQGMDKLPETVCGRDVDIGVIAVPQQAAQEVADHLILAGVRGILNMTAAHIVAPKKVPVVDARIVASLQELAYAIKTEAVP
jgi:redox-sensing transcriptional repressor